MIKAGIMILLNGSKNSPQAKPPLPDRAVPPPSVPPPLIVTVRANSLYVRKGPNIGDDRIATVFREDKLTVLGRNQSGSWFLITSPKKGWVAANSEYVKWDFDMSTVPIYTPDMQAQ